MTKPRQERAGAIHHVWARTTLHRSLFHDDDDRRHYLQTFAIEAHDRGWTVHSYCLMTNHVHWMVETPKPDLGLGIHAIHGAFALHANSRDGASGHCFDARFGNRIVDGPGPRLRVLRYIGRNPVPVLASRPEDWSWSAHRALLGLEPAPWFLDVDAALAPCGSGLEAARAVYDRYTALDDLSLIASLAAAASDDSWLLRAVDDFALRPEDIAAVLGLSRATVYRRIATVRQKGQSLPSQR